LLDVIYFRFNKSVMQWVTL